LRGCIRNRELVVARLVVARLVVARLVPAIHVFMSASQQDVDARHKAGHDEILIVADD